MVPTTSTRRGIEVVATPASRLGRNLAAVAVASLPVSALVIAVLYKLAIANLRGGVGHSSGLLGWLFLGHTRYVYVGITMLAVMLLARWIVLFRRKGRNESRLGEWMQIAAVGYGVSILAVYGMVVVYGNVTS